MIEQGDFEKLGFPPDPPPDAGPGFGGFAEDVSSMTPAEAAAEIDSVFRDPEHPYNRQHYQHPQAVERMSKLFAKKAEGDTRSAVEKVCDDAFEQQAEKQDKLVSEAQVEMEKLVELGFDEAEVPDDIMPHQVVELRMQRLAAENDYETLTPLIEKELPGLKVPPDVQGLFGGFCRVQGLDEGLRQEILEKIIWWIHRANEQKFGAKK